MKIFLYLTMFVEESYFVAIKYHTENEICSVTFVFLLKEITFVFSLWNFRCLTNGVSQNMFNNYQLLKVIQRRQDGSENFYRNWTEYEIGFGSPSSEVWLGKMLSLCNSYISLCYIYCQHVQYKIWTGKGSFIFVRL